MAHTITIRRSHEGDENALARLAGLDSRRAPRGEALLGFVGGELRAALDLSTGSAVADPFAPTADVVQLLRVRAGESDAPARSNHVLERLWKVRPA